MKRCKTCYYNRVPNGSAACADCAGISLWNPPNYWNEDEAEDFYKKHGWPVRRKDGTVSEK